MLYISFLKTVDTCDRQRSAKEAHSPISYETVTIVDPCHYSSKIEGLFDAEYMYFKPEIFYRKIFL